MSKTHCMITPLYTSFEGNRFIANYTLDLFSKTATGVWQSGHRALVIWVLYIIFFRQLVQVYLFQPNSLAAIK